MFSNIGKPIIITNKIFLYYILYHKSLYMFLVVPSINNMNNQIFYDSKKVSFNSSKMFKYLLGII